jgi:5-epi-alpha-selinene synthase
MRADVQVISAQEFSGKADDLLVPPSFRLRFPRLWVPRPLQNRYATAIEEETISWLQSYGIGRVGEEEERLRKFNCAFYGGYSLPLADYRAGLLVTQFISLWLFWDDMQVEEGQDWDLEEVVAALTEAAPLRSPSRYVAAWFDIGRRLRATQSRRWLGHLATTMREWLTNARVETGLAKTYQRTGVCPEVTTLFDCRTISIGMFPTFHLIELAEGFELPDAVHADPTVVALKRLASRLVGVGNDLGGLAKDIRNRWLNLVLVLAARATLTIDEAFQQVVDIHNAEVAEFDRLAGSLPRWGARIDALLAGWLQAVRYNVHGFTLWESTAQRYQEWKAFTGRTALIAPVG